MHLTGEIVFNCKPEESVKMLEDESRLRRLCNDGELLGLRAIVNEIVPGTGPGSTFIMVLRNMSMAAALV